ncbi:MAG: beta-(1-3)-glucosyl transferase [Desulfobulbaceae bacterium A2]|nr:MAG: beta-(1-3)-glucosyl transferase [Desulfobulbaceae bacterium A2]
MNSVNIIIAAAIAAVTISVHALLNRPTQEPPWPPVIQGFAFSPMRSEHDPTKHILPSAEQIEGDLALLKGRSHAIRTYTLEGDLAKIPQLARKYKLNVALGAWLSGDLEANEREIAELIRVVRANPSNVKRVIVGNEVLFRDDLPAEKLIEYIDRVQKALSIPVSTAEIWSNWLLHPELADHVDYVAVHVLPYWEGIEVDKAVEFVVNSINNIKIAFPGKEVVIGEVGWPSNGRDRRHAVASLANQATFLRRFLARAEKENYVYYVMEAFDQPWKMGDAEGAVGGYWGVWDVERQEKFPFEQPIIANPAWRVLGGVSVLLAAITFLLMVAPSRTLQPRGRGFLALVAYAAATTAVWVVHSYLDQYLSLRGIVVGAVLLVGMIGVITVLMTEAHEWAETLWVTGRRRGFQRIDVSDDRLPKVSVHVPAYNEPPEMMIETLDALARMDYPNFEVLVIDNNTKKTEVWQPVQAHCEKLGPRFRFFHVDPLAGFKAGALNFALRQTAPDAEVVAVIDSDYAVHPRWLHDLAPQFTRPEVAIVQAPQDYRDGVDNAFKAMCYSEYAGFFYIGMITRNERNAIIQHGTMTMVRRRVLEDVGGWAEWCITEDAELGLRIFEAGYEAHYIPRSYGRGVMPDTYSDFKKQRFRWAYGSIQILRQHAGQLFSSRGNKLTLGQRYHFVAGWLPWLADGFNLVVTMGALFWSCGMILAPLKFDPPMMAFSALPLALLTFKIAKLFYIYRVCIGASTVQTLVGAMAGLSLSHTIARAVSAGFVTRTIPFFRTPKLADRQSWFGALLAVPEELTLLVALSLAAWGVAATQGTDTHSLLLWVFVLLTQAFPYLMSVVVSLVSSFPHLSARAIGVKPIEGPG